MRSRAVGAIWQIRLNDLKRLMASPLVALARRWDHCCKWKNARWCHCKISVFAPPPWKNWGVSRTI